MAPFQVAALKASSIVKPQYTLDKAIINGMDCKVHDPGLKSVARARSHPESIIFLPGAYVFLPRKNVVPGSNVAMTPLSAIA